MLPKRSKNIFIVEDNELYAMMLDYILTKDSVYRFVSFNSGEECLDNLYLSPDVVILDYGLPGINGYETLLEIKKRKPSVHVIMLSTHTDPVLATKLLKAGADDYVFKKGHGENQITAKIEHLLQKDELERDKQFDKASSARMFYVIIIITLLTFGFAYLTR